MPQGNPEGYLTEKLMNEGAAPQQGAAPQSVSSLRPLVTNEMEDFLMTLIELADSHGVLDESMNPNGSDSIEERIESIDADAMQEFSRDEWILLVGKFQKIPPEVQQQLLDLVKQEDPRLHARILSAIRMTSRGPGPIENPNGL